MDEEQVTKVYADTFKEYLNTSKVLEASKKAPFECDSLRILPEDILWVSYSKYGDIDYKKNDLICLDSIGTISGTNCRLGCYGGSLMEDGNLLLKCMRSKNIKLKVLQDIE